MKCVLFATKIDGLCLGSESIVSKLEAKKKFISVYNFFLHSFSKRSTGNKTKNIEKQFRNV